MKRYRRPETNEGRQGILFFRRFLLVVLIALLAFSFVLLRSFLNPIILAILLTSITSPVHKRLRKLLGGRTNLSALVMVLLATVVIALPLLAFLFLLIVQGVEFIRGGVVWISSGGLDRLSELPVFTTIEGWYSGVFAQSKPLGDQLVSMSESFAKGLVNSGVKFFGNTVTLVSRFGIFVFTLFFLYRDGPRMAENLRDMLPMRRRQTNRIFAQVKDVTHAVLLGTFLVALIQGALAAVGLAIVGVPGLVWGTAIGFSSMIPMVGTFLITAPMTVYLFTTGALWKGVFFGIWALLVVGGIDNLLRPLFMKGKARMSVFFVFLGVIGGISYFGMSGLIYGPLVIALTMVVLGLYRSEFSGMLKTNRR
jgi:predicted PurR-regulated permease PerM